MGVGKYGKADRPSRKRKTRTFHGNQHSESQLPESSSVPEAGETQNAAEIEIEFAIETQNATETEK